MRSLPDSRFPVVPSSGPNPGGGQPSTRSLAMGFGGEEEGRVGSLDLRKGSALGALAATGVKGLAHPKLQHRDARRVAENIGREPKIACFVVPVTCCAEIDVEVFDG